MAIQTNRLAQILSGRYRGLLAGLVGLSIGGLFAIGCAYGGVGERVSPDVFACLVVFALFTGWAGAWGSIAKSERQAKKIADILSNPGLRVTFDRQRNILVLEQVENVDLGLGAPTETIANRATVTLEEAHLIGLEIDTSRKRLLLQGARTERRQNDAPAVDLPMDDAAPTSATS